MARLKKIKKGLPWFLAEVAIIIVGILLSLLITSWVSDYRDGRKERAFLEQIELDLQEDLATLESGLEFRARQLNYAATTLAAINDPSKEPDISGTIGGLQAMMTVDVFEPSNVTFRSLESTGQLALIDNSAIVKGLIDLYTNAYVGLQLNTDDVNSYRNRYFLPYVINNFDLNGSMSRGESGDIARILADPVFQNHLVYYRISLFSTQGAYKRVIEEASQLIELIGDELK